MPGKMRTVAQKAIEFSFYFLLAIVPLVFSPSNFELFEFPKMILVYATTVVILTLWATKSILVGKLIFRHTFLDLPLLIFLVSQFLSSLVSIDVHTSLWGFYTRSYGGLLSIVTFALLYWAYVSNMDKRKTKNVIRFLLASAAVVSFWGILEHFGASPGCYFMKGKFDASCWEPDVSARVFASFGQPNWLAAWLAGVAPLSWTLLVKRHTANEKSSIVSRITCYVLPPLIFLALLYTKSTSGLIGFAVAFVVFWILVLPHATNHTHRVFAVLIAIHLLLITLIGTRFTPSIGQILVQYRINNIQQSESKGIETPNDERQTTNNEPAVTDSFTIRKIVWKGAIEIWKHYPIFGSGVETFAYTYYNFRPIEHNLTSEWDLLYNKAHNEYLHYLANTGIAGLATYLLFIATAMIAFIKVLNSKHEARNPKQYKNSKHLKFRNLNLFRISDLEFRILPLALLAGFTSILVTNFTGFTTVPVTTLFFLYPAMAVTLGTREKALGTGSHHPSWQQAFIAPLLIPIAYCLLPIASLYHADTLYARADKLNDAGEGQAATELLEKAVKLRPGEPRYYNELATSTSLVAADLAESADREDRGKAFEFAQLAEQHSDKALKISSRNVNLWSNRSVVFKRLVGIDQKYLALAIQALEQAIKLAPTEPEVHYNLGVLYTRSHQSEKAQQLLEKAVMLKTDYYDGRLGLAEFYLQSGEEEKAIEQFKHILEKINPGDKTVKEILETLRQQKQ